jgi:hypothetical protein
MAEWMGWLVAAGVLVILELFTGTFYLLMIAIGLAVGGLVSCLAPADRCRRSRRRRSACWRRRCCTARASAGRRNMTPRATATSTSTSASASPCPAWDNGRARVMYRGALWDVELGQGATPLAGDFRIVEVQGSRLWWPIRREFLIIRFASNTTTFIRDAHGNFFRYRGAGDLHHRAGVRLQDHQRGAPAARLGGRAARQVPRDAGARPEHRRALHRPHRLQAQPEGDPARRAAPGLHHQGQHPAAGGRHPVLPGDGRDARVLRLVEFHHRRSPSWPRPRCAR